MSTAPDSPSSPWFVYILQCSDGSLYVGHTNDVAERVKRHNDGRGAAWTVARRPVVLLYHEPHATEAQAMAREQQLKGWSTGKKHALIRGDLTTLKALSRRRQRAS